MNAPYLSSLTPSVCSSISVTRLRIPGELSSEQAHELGRIAFDRREQHGTIAELSRQFCVSRQHVIDCREAFEAHLLTLFNPQQMAVGTWVKFLPFSGVEFPSMISKKIFNYRDLVG